MSLTVIVPNGRTEITVNGLHQWDYGRTIEIHSANLPALVEVHFACTGMETAVVRNCAVVDGKTTAAIPDICLEQTTPIVAWVYAIGAASGETILTITLPITPRTKPQPNEAIPEYVGDRYTEAIAAMTGLIEGFNSSKETMQAAIKGDIVSEIESGEIVAKQAGAAGRADEADHADEADYADGADTAIVLNVAPLEKPNPGGSSFQINSAGIYVVVFENSFNQPCSAFIAIADLTMIANCAQPDSKLIVYYDPNYKGVCVFSGASIQDKIVAVYKIADIQGGSEI